VLYAAFTGKAALVMTRKGTPASTIHSLIYRVSDATPEEIATHTPRPKQQRQVAICRSALLSHRTLCRA
jgi:hypothetical protein